MRLRGLIRAFRFLRLFFAQLDRARGTHKIIIGRIFKQGAWQSARGRVADLAQGWSLHRHPLLEDGACHVLLTVTQQNAFHSAVIQLYTLELAHTGV